MARSLEEIHDSHEAENAFDNAKAAPEEEAGENLKDDVLATGDRVNAQVAGTDVRVQEAVERAPNRVKATKKRLEKNEGRADESNE